METTEKWCAGNWIQFDYGDINIDGFETTQYELARRRVPGGWIVRYMQGETASITFVPDPPKEEERP